MDMETTLIILKPDCVQRGLMGQIICRLEAKGLVTRTRSDRDRRKVMLTLTGTGIELAKGMPWPLQERFKEGLASLGEEELARIDEALEKVFKMMEAPEMEVWPYGYFEAMPSDAEVLQPEPKDGGNE